VGFLLATRYLARDPAFYTTPLILLILTLSLSAFTASLAQTLDNHLYDQSYYRTGADLRLVELGRSNQVSEAGAGAASSTEGGTTTATTTAATGAAAATGPNWVFIPVSEHLKVPEILGAARIGEFGSSVQVQGSWMESVFMGIDRIDFPKATYWRRDFAPASLGALMNALAVSPDGLLMRRDFMRQNSIRVGDAIQVRVSNYGQRAEIAMKVAGEFDYFPTWYEDEPPLMVGNLDYLFEQVGGEMPYDVWAKTAPNANFDKVITDLRGLDFVVLDWQSSALRIATEQQRPERQGLFGVLSVGFLAAALLTVLGFLLYALFSFRRRFIELGTLRAMGLSPVQMTTFLAWELAFLIILGLVAGTILGSLISQVFIPYLQVGADVASKTPPFQVEIAWSAIFRIYALFAALFLVALSVLAGLLLRMKIFQAIKLGETV